jgi:hypothetical protein
MTPGPPRRRGGRELDRTCSTPWNGGGTCPRSRSEPRGPVPRAGIEILAVGRGFAVVRGPSALEGRTGAVASMVPIPRRGVPRPLRSVFAVFHDPDGLHLSEPSGVFQPVTLVEFGLHWSSPPEAALTPPVRGPSGRRRPVRPFRVFELQTAEAIRGSARLRRPEDRLGASVQVPPPDPAPRR